MFPKYYKIVEEFPLTLPPQFDQTTTRLHTFTFLRLVCAKKRVKLYLSVSEKIQNSFIYTNDYFSLSNIAVFKNVY